MDTLNELNIRVTKEEMKTNIRPLLRLVCNRFIGDFSGFVDMCVEHIKSPLDNAKTKVDHIYTGPKEGILYDHMIRCNQNETLMVHSSKMYPNDDCTFFQVIKSYCNKNIFFHLIMNTLGSRSSFKWNTSCWTRNSSAG